MVLDILHGFGHLLYGNIPTLKSYQEYPSDYFPSAESQILNSLKDAEQAQFFRNIIQASFVKEAALCIMQHGSNWLEFPKFFAAGADSRWNSLFWRVVLRVLGRQVKLQKSNECQFLLKVMLWENPQN